MSNKETYFPAYETLELAPGVKSKVYKAGDTTIMISEMQPGAVVNPHSHEEAQIGLVLQGALEMTVEGETRVINELADCYYAQPHAVHSAINNHGSVIVTVDIKRKLKKKDKAPRTFMPLENHKTWKNGLTVDFFVGEWFEIMKSTIPAGGEMPEHKHTNEQLGICFKGGYTMQVDSEVNENYRAGDVYYAPPNTNHYAINHTGETAESLNIFIPKRYNKKSGVQE